MNGNNVYLGNPSWPRCNETHVASHDGKLGKDGTCEMEQKGDRDGCRISPIMICFVAGGSWLHDASN